MISLKNKNRLISAAPCILLTEGCSRAFNDLINNPLNYKVQGYYNDSTVKVELEKYHGNKCVYCETDTSAGASYRVDHYRPKKYIKNIDKTLHYGYFWLAFEWTNFLQSCEACNRAKSNEFPLINEANRIKHVIETNSSDPVLTYRHILDSPLNKEERLLLHPELDNVESFLIFKLDGTVVPVKSDKNDIVEIIGKETIRICKLNRGTLIKARKKKIDRFYHNLIEILNDFEDRGATDSAKKFLYSDLRNYFVRMLREQQEDEQYSRVGFYMFDNFKTFYTNRLTFYGDINLVNDYYDSL